MRTTKRIVLKRSGIVNAPLGRGVVGGGRWVYGINPVLRRLAVARSSVRQLCMTDRASGRLLTIQELAQQAHVPVRFEDTATLFRLTGSGNHQGVAALTFPFFYQDFAALLEKGLKSVLVLDQIQ